MGPETSHVHKIIYGPLIDTALYVMCLMGANSLKGKGYYNTNYWPGCKNLLFIGRAARRGLFMRPVQYERGLLIGQAVKTADFLLARI